MRFQFFPLRFEFVARDPLHFPPGKAGNTLRGALGIIFKRMACVAGCLDANLCPSRDSCAYARVFEPVASGARPGPSGLADPPRPFVFRARHLDGSALQPGEPFHFDLHLFSLDPAVLAGFVRTFAALSHEGLGYQRGKAELRCVRCLAVRDLPEQIVYSGATGLLSPPDRPVTLDLAPRTSAPHVIRVHFLSPTELKHQRHIVSRPEFPILFGRIRDRISTLRALYGPGPLSIDFREMGVRADAVRMTSCQVRKLEVERYSTRTGRTHSLGGFVGFAEYQGELAEFLPYIEAACWVGVGRQSVWGKGEISVDCY